MSIQIFQVANQYEVRFVDQSTGCERLHTHEYPVIAAVLGGGVSMQMHAETLVLSADEVLYIAPHQRHAVCGFEPRFCGVYTLALLDPTLGGAAIRPELDSAVVFIDLCEWLLAAHSEAVKYKRLSEWLATVRVSADADTSESAVQTSPLAERVKALVDAVAGERVPFDEVARRCGCSQEHCNRHFKMSYGVTIQTYQLNRKAERARHLLATDLSLSDIALEAGFYDQSHMSRLFKSIFQVTPELYRDKNRN